MSPKIHFWTTLVASTGSSGRLCIRNRSVSVLHKGCMNERGKPYLRNPSLIFQLEESRNMALPTLISLLPRLSLGLFNGRFGSRGSLHILGIDGIGQLGPQSATKKTVVLAVEKNWARLGTNLRDSLSSCTSSGGTHLGEIFCPSFIASNRVRFWPFCTHIRPRTKGTIKMTISCPEER
jgi:hypothetical protein